MTKETVSPDGGLILREEQAEAAGIIFESVFFFFQAEDGIRDLTVTGVQTCALPISASSRRAARRARPRPSRAGRRPRGAARRPDGSGLPPGLRATARWRGRPSPQGEIGRASCRERV